MVGLPLAGTGSAIPPFVMVGEGRPSTSFFRAPETKKRGWSAFADHDEGGTVANRRETPRRFAEPMPPVSRAYERSGSPEFRPRQFLPRPIGPREHGQRQVERQRETCAVAQRKSGAPGLRPERAGDPRQVQRVIHRTEGLRVGQADRRPTVDAVFHQLGDDLRQVHRGNHAVAQDGPHRFSARLPVEHRQHGRRIQDRFRHRRIRIRAPLRAAGPRSASPTG